MRTTEYQLKLSENLLFTTQCEFGETMIAKTIGPSLTLQLADQCICLPTHIVDFPMMMLCHSHMTLLDIHGCGICGELSRNGMGNGTSDQE